MKKRFDLFIGPLVAVLVSMVVLFTTAVSQSTLESVSADSITVCAQYPGSSWTGASIPVGAENDSVRHWFPGATFPYIFVWVEGYVRSYTLPPRKGFLIMFPSSSSVCFTGSRIATIPVEEGWNLIGSFSYPVDTSAIRSVPPGIISTQFVYAGSSQAADTIRPGLAYWLKTSRAGKLVLVR